MQLSAHDLKQLDKETIRSLQAEPLRPVQANVYLAAGNADLAVLAARHEVLDADERERAGRFVRVWDRDLFRAAHVLLRQSLSCHADMSPSAWRFRRSRHGRPEVDTTRYPAGEGLHFNLTHTAALACCVVTRDAAVGIDAERHRPMPDAVNLARRFFAAAEAAAMIEVATDTEPEAQSAAFFSLWTLKEAYLKGKGVGLTERLDHFSFRLGTMADPRGIEFKSDCAPDAEAKHWRFVQARVMGDWTLAVALYAPLGARVRLIPVSPIGNPPRVEARACSAMVELRSVMR